MATTITVRVTVFGDTPENSLAKLQELLDNATVVSSYTTDTYTGEDGEEHDTAELMG